MTVQMNEQSEQGVLVLHVSGKLTREDYARFVPEVERLIGQHGKIRILFEMHDFHGWSAGAMWDDLKFDLKHFTHIERLAIIGEKKWQKGMAAFCRPFTTAEIRYFDRSQSDLADAWLHEQHVAA